MTDTHCIYHHGCPDGFTAAWIVRQNIPDVVLHPGRHGDDPPDVFSGSVVYIVDFSYSADKIRAMASIAEKVIILDHHKTAQAELERNDLGDNVNVVFDMDRSGAMITYNHFKNTPPYAKPLVEYVQDRDLWLFQLKDSRAITSVILATDHTMANWDELAMDLRDQWGDHRQTEGSKIVAQGEAILKRDAKVQKDIISCARRMTIGGYEVLAAPSPYAYGSEVAGELAKRNGVLFGAYYVDRPEHRQFGLRSVRGSGCDVSVIAKEYGGGGHENAAGFNVPWGHELTT